MLHSNYNFVMSYYMFFIQKSERPGIKFCLKNTSNSIFFSFFSINWNLDLINFFRDVRMSSSPLTDSWLIRFFERFSPRLVYKLPINFSSMWQTYLISSAWIDILCNYWRILWLIISIRIRNTKGFFWCWRIDFMTKYYIANSYRFAGLEKEYKFIQKWPFGI